MGGPQRPQGAALRRGDADRCGRGPRGGQCAYVVPAGEVGRPGHGGAPERIADRAVHRQLQAPARGTGAGLRRHRQPAARPAGGSASSTATTTAIATCRCTCSVVSSCCARTCGPAASMRPSMRRRSSSRWYAGRARPGLRCASSSAATRASPPAHHQLVRALRRALHRRPGAQPGRWRPGSSTRTWRCTSSTCARSPSQRRVDELSYAAQSWPHERAIAIVTDNRAGARARARVGVGQSRAQPALRGDEPGRRPARALYDDLYCQRGEAENRIKEARRGAVRHPHLVPRLRLRNQLRVLLAALAYVLIERLRALAL